MTPYLSAIARKRRSRAKGRELERFEIQSLFAQIDCQTLLGQRDDVLLRLPYRDKSGNWRRRPFTELFLRLTAGVEIQAAVAIMMAQSTVHIYI
jgi:hypothetical protein